MEVKAVALFEVEPELIGAAEVVLVVVELVVVVLELEPVAVRCLEMTLHILE